MSKTVAVGNGAAIRSLHCVQVESEVKDVNNKFARLRGIPNAAHSLDLYGRSFSLTPTPEASRPNMRIRRSGRTSQGPRLK